MSRGESTWILVTDKRRGRLFQVHQTALGEPDLEEESSFTTSWVESEHNRPSPLVARGTQVYASREREDREEQRFCAREIARWIRSKVEELRPERLKLVAPHRFVDDLRKELDGEHFDLSVAELTNLSKRELGRHPILKTWLGIA